GHLPLLDCDDVHEGRQQSLLGKNRWMPTTQDDRQAGIAFLDCLADCDRSLDHWPGDERNAQTESIFRLTQHGFNRIPLQRFINDLHLKTVLKQRCRNRDQGKWWGYLGTSI